MVKCKFGTLDSVPRTSTVLKRVQKIKRDISLQIYSNYFRLENLTKLSFSFFFFFIIIMSKVGGTIYSLFVCLFNTNNDLWMPGTCLKAWKTEGRPEFR